MKEVIASSQDRRLAAQRLLHLLVVPVEGQPEQQPPQPQRQVRKKHREVAVPPTGTVALANS